MEIKEERNEAQNERWGGQGTDDEMVDKQNKGKKAKAGRQGWEEDIKKEVAQNNMDKKRE